MRFLLPFRTSQVDQIEFSCSDFGLSLNDFFLLDSYHEDAVRARRLLVHICGACVPIFAAFYKFAIHFLHSCDHDSTEVFNVDPLILVFMQLQLLVLLFRKQIDYLFVVEL